ncbi:acetyl-CoA carboxylase carboxyltransferase subunit beta [Ponticaulis sp.]|uniref:acetyl-CoA carboxylase carboxyltransferase subunit beta n=1 Tax=Ponticaulis sp. TaxID=2020902 RepID=UPI00260B8CBA|nr:acetyl-CoA carboxylase carboxyltransferase subunit beta [Ponticaulis sp.]MDF1679329.1 acetyl-CoA carboxylase carboxyltransferase subunit beta [Ponticaulis sp.]
MNWLSNISPPGLKSVFGKRETPDNLWVKCPKSGELIFKPDLEASYWVTPSGAHLRVGPLVRFRALFDDQKWEAIELPDVPRDPLKFKDDKRYVDRLKGAKAKISERNKADPNGENIIQDDCMAAAIGLIGGKPAVVLVQDFAFMGGSLGMAAGEAFIKAAETAVARDAALIVCTASGGARMQEGTLSLMQMPRTTLAIDDVREAGLPYLVVLTDPTSGGVSASYAMLGDVHLAEPEAMIAFSGPRVIEQTIRQKLPEGFQRSEFLKDKGVVDMVVDRREMGKVIGSILGHLMSRRKSSSKGVPPVSQPRVDVVE